MFAASICPSAHDRRYSRLCVITDVTSPRPVIRSRRARGKIRTAPSHVAESRDPADFGLDVLLFPCRTNLLAAGYLSSGGRAGGKRPCGRGPRAIQRARRGMCDECAGGIHRSHDILPDLESFSFCCDMTTTKTDSPEEMSCCITLFY